MSPADSPKMNIYGDATQVVKGEAAVAVANEYYTNSFLQNEVVAVVVKEYHTNSFLQNASVLAFC